jgi:hypothetical protein
MEAKTLKAISDLSPSTRYPPPRFNFFAWCTFIFIFSSGPKALPRLAHSYMDTGGGARSYSVFGSYSFFLLACSNQLCQIGLTNAT